MLFWGSPPPSCFPASMSLCLCMMSHLMQSRCAKYEVAQRLETQTGSKKACVQLPDFHSSAFVTLLLWASVFHICKKGAVEIITTS